VTVATAVGEGGGWLDGGAIEAVVHATRRVGSTADRIFAFTPAANGRAARMARGALPRPLPLRASNGSLRIAGDELRSGRPMNALELISAVSQLVYVLIFVLVLLRTLRYPAPSHADMTLFFGTATIIIVASRLAPLFGSPTPEWVVIVEFAALMALPYELLRLLSDFTTVRPSLMRLSEVGLAASVLSVIVFGGLPPALIVFAMAVYFAAVFLYGALRFVREAQRSQGVTRRRLQSVSAGAVLLAATLLVAVIPLLLPQGLAAVVGGITQIFALASGAALFLGFTPPRLLKQAWQAPELYAFLSRASELPRLPSTMQTVRELERAAARATGASATIGLWDEEKHVLRFLRTAPSEETVEVRPGELAGGRAYASQRVEFSADPIHDHPEGAETYRSTGVGAAIAAPISTGEHRVGVLCIFAPRPPFFAESDMELVGLLADQAAAILEARGLIDQAASVRAREESTRLKEDFLSAAAHDLRTPLTTVVAQAQFLERRARRDPAAPADVRGLDRIAREAERLRDLVADLLDATRLEERRLVAERESVDLGAIAADVIARRDKSGRRVRLEVRSPVVGSYDERRMQQLLDNLVENATKYSRDGAPVTVEVWQEGTTARISVNDRGIGIPAADLPTIFDRFTRGSNVDDRSFHGMGLGLYICRGIVEEHGGRIWAESKVGAGSTFHVELPVTVEGGTG
jgi:signal transduction histidine kinase